MGELIAFGVTITLLSMCPSHEICI